MSNTSLRYFAPLGRLLLSLIFLASAAGKIADWQMPAKMMADKGVPAVDALLSVAIALEILGGLLVLLGFYARFGAFLLLVFIVPVSVVMHNFWTMEQGPQQTEQMINFMKNISISGGLLMVLALGAGPVSVDAVRESQPPPAPVA